MSSSQRRRQRRATLRASVASPSPASPAAAPLSGRTLLAAAARVTGGPLDAEGYRWRIVAIEAGPSKIRHPETGRQVWVAPEPLQAAVTAGVFSTDSYRDHPDATEEAAGIRSVDDKIGRVANAMWDPSVVNSIDGKVYGGVVAEWTVFDETIRERLLAAHKNGVADLYDFSIYGPALTEPRSIEGADWEYLTQLASCTVDLVTDGAAGGRFLTQLAASMRRAVEAPMKWSIFKAAKAALAKALLSASDAEAVALLDSLEIKFAAGERDAFLADLRAERTTVNAPAGHSVTIVAPAAPAPSATAAAAPPPAAGPTCPQCGSACPMGAAFCPTDGTKLDAAAPTPAAPVPAAAAAPALPSQDELVAAAVARIEAKIVTERETAAEIAAAVASLPEGKRPFAEKRLKACRSKVERDEFLVDFRASLAGEADAAFAGFPDVTLRGSDVPTQGIEAGRDNLARYRSALHGWFAQGFKRKDGNVEEAPFASLREAVMAWPGHRNVRFVTPEFLSASLAVAYHSGKRRSVYTGQFEDGPWVMRGGNWVRLAAAVTTSQFGEIFQDVMFKELMLQYDAASDYQNLLPLASKLSYFTDFKQHHSIRVGGYANFASVTEGGTYQLMTTPDDNEEKLQLVKYGGIESISWESTLDPDGQKLSMLPGKFGAAMGRTFREAILTHITSENPTLNSDSIALYDSGTHVNLGTTALSVEGLRLGTVAMAQQAELSSAKRLGAVNTPKYLFHPIELRGRVNRIINPSGVRDFYTAITSADADTTLKASEFEGALIPIEITHATNAKDYFLMADPRVMPTFEIARLAGVDTPEMWSKTDPMSDTMWNTDQGGLKIRFPFDVQALDYRSFYMQDVA